MALVRLGRRVAAGNKPHKDGPRDFRRVEEFARQRGQVFRKIECRSEQERGSDEDGDRENRSCSARLVNDGGQSHCICGDECPQVTGRVHVVMALRTAYQLARSPEEHSQGHGAKCDAQHQADSGPIGSVPLGHYLLGELSSACVETWRARRREGVWVDNPQVLVCGACRD